MLVVCFSGRIGSGKTSVTQTLAEALGWSRAGFGDYVRRRLQHEGGDPSSREQLQDLGQHLVDTDPDGFCRAVLQAVSFKAGGNLIVDGVRHVDVYRRIARIVLPSQTKLIHIAADDGVVRQRIEARSEDIEDLARAEKHRVEADLQISLPSIADYLIDGTLPLREVVLTAISAIENTVEAGAIEKARIELSKMKL